MFKLARPEALVTLRYVQLFGTITKAYCIEQIEIREDVMMKRMRKVSFYLVLLFTIMSIVGCNPLGFIHSDSNKSLIEVIK